MNCGWARCVSRNQRPRWFGRFSDSYQEGASYNQIAGFLGSQPVPYREDGQPWNKNMVARILQDERYTGMDDFPRVIEPEIFQTIQQKRPKTGGSPENAKELRLLRDLVVCAHCGTPMARNQRDNWTCPQCGGPLGQENRAGAAGGSPAPADALYPAPGEDPSASIPAPGAS